MFEAASPDQGRSPLSREAHPDRLESARLPITLRLVHQVAENLWTLRFPQSLLGAEVGRTVSVIRLQSGELVIHSTAPFSAADVSDIEAAGQPAWLIEATLFHDTFVKAGREAFSGIPYLVPDGFPAINGGTVSLRTPPSDWSGELEVLPLDGMPKVREYVFFHRPTRTLIVADLVFNFGLSATPWTRFFFRWGAGIRQFPGMSRLFRFSIRDRKAFAASVRQLMKWDFDRLIVGHGDVIESGAKDELAAALAQAGL